MKVYHMYKMRKKKGNTYDNLTTKMLKITSRQKVKSVAIWSICSNRTTSFCN